MEDKKKRCKLRLKRQKALNAIIIILNEWNYNKQGWHGGAVASTEGAGFESRLGPFHMEFTWSLSAGTQSAVQTYAWGWVNWWFLNWPQVWMCATDRWPVPGCTLCPALWIGSSNPKSDGWMKNKYSTWNLYVVYELRRTVCLILYSQLVSADPKWPKKSCRLKNKINYWILYQILYQKLIYKIN